MSPGDDVIFYENIVSSNKEVNSSAYSRYSLTSVFLMIFFFIRIILYIIFFFIKYNYPNLLFLIFNMIILYLIYKKFKWSYYLSGLLSMSFIFYSFGFCIYIVLYFGKLMWIVVPRPSLLSTQISPLCVSIIFLHK